MRGNGGERAARKRSVWVCVRYGTKARTANGVNKGGGENPIVFGVEREKALLYVAIIETMSVIILRIERQYKQFPYITT